MTQKKNRANVKARIFEIIQIGKKDSTLETVFDVGITIAIFLNLFAVIFSTFDESAPYKDLLDIIEIVTVIIFTVEYALRIWTADLLYPGEKVWKARIKYIFSFYGLIDLLTLLPFYLPMVFPSGIVAFRAFRVIRIFRLFKLNSQYDAFRAISDVLKEKKNQILSSVSLILILMLASSLAMYWIEHDAQPDIFKNAFSGIWWAVSTLLTIGYGDVYPVTVMGKAMAILISFLGVGMVAIPTGIISAGFVEQYTKLSRRLYEAEEQSLKFVTSVLTDNHPWNNKMIKDVIFPPQLILVIVIRDDEEMVPKGDLVLKSGDALVLGAKNYSGMKDIELKEILVKSENEWVGLPIKELDISRNELIVMIQRRNKVIVPNGSTVIKNGDKIIMYDKHASR